MFGDCDMNLSSLCIVNVLQCSVPLRISTFPHTAIKDTTDISKVIKPNNALSYRTFVKGILPWKDEKKRGTNGLSRSSFLQYLVGGSERKRSCHSGQMMPLVIKQSHFGLLDAKPLLKFGRSISESEHFYMQVDQFSGLIVGLRFCPAHQNVSRICI